MALSDLLAEADRAGSAGAFFGPVASYSIRIKYVQDRQASLAPDEIAGANAKMQEWANVGGTIFQALNVPDHGGFTNVVKSVPVVGKPLSDISARISGIADKIPVVEQVANTLEHNELAKKIAKIGVAVIGPSAIASSAISAAGAGGNASAIFGGASSGTLVASSPIFDYVAVNLFARKNDDQYLDKANNFAGVGKVIVATAGAAGLFTPAAVAGTGAGGAVGGGTAIALPSAGVAVPGIGAISSGVATVGGIVAGVKNIFRKPETNDPISNYNTPIGDRDGATSESMSPVILYSALALAAAAGVYFFARKA